MSREIPVVLKNIVGICFFGLIIYIVVSPGNIFDSSTNTTGFMVLRPIFALIGLVVFFLLSIYVARIDAHSQLKSSKTTLEKLIENGIIITLLLIIAVATFSFYFH